MVANVFLAIAAVATSRPSPSFLFQCHAEMVLVDTTDLSFSHSSMNIALGLLAVATEEAGLLQDPVVVQMKLPLLCVELTDSVGSPQEDVVAGILDDLVLAKDVVDAVNVSGVVVPRTATTGNMQSHNVVKYV